MSDEHKSEEGQAQQVFSKKAYADWMDDESEEKSNKSEEAFDADKYEGLDGHMRL